MSERAFKPMMGPSTPKWGAVGVRIVRCDACGRDDQVIFRLRHAAADIFVYRCREHSDITSLTDPKQVEW